MTPPSLLLGLLFTLVGLSVAFPSFRSDDSNISPFLQRRSIPDPLKLSERSAQLERIHSRQTTKGATAYTPDSAHPYQAPGPNDERGPCPGLNTLANHGYLPRNGIAHWQDIIEGTKDGFNMAYDLGTILAVYGVLSEGDVTTGMLSIGANLPSAIAGGKKGLQTHGAFEGDASLARLDEYPTGKNWQFDQGTYNEFKAANTKYSGGNATLESLTEYRYQVSRSKDRSVDCLVHPTDPLRSSLISVIWKARQTTLSSPSSFLVISLHLVKLLLFCKCLPIATMEVKTTMSHPTSWTASLSIRPSHRILFRKNNLTLSQQSLSMLFESLPLDSYHLV